VKVASATGAATLAIHDLGHGAQSLARVGARHHSFFECKMLLRIAKL